MPSRPGSLARRSCRSGSTTSAPRQHGLRPKSGLGQPHSGRASKNESRVVQRTATFLDRDGVIIESRRHAGKPGPPASVDDVTIPDGVSDALESLRTAGYGLIVVTNQPDVARGTTERETVEAINTYISRALPIDDVYTCLHDGS